ncbi:hypothetical protein GCM10022631_17670 [Deinococcus rubellus]
MTLVALLLTGCDVHVFRSAAPIRPPSIGSYHHATFERLQQDEAMVTLEDGEVVNAVVTQGGPIFHAGQSVIVWQSGDNYILQEPVRTPGLLGLLGLLVVAAVLLGRWKGLRAVIGAALSLAVLALLVVPQLAQGTRALPTALLGTLGILCLTIYFVHGVGRKTSAALLGTALTTLVGWGLALYVTHAMQFTGTVSEGGYVASTVFRLDPLDLYLLGIVIGTVGALNDVTVTQAAVVQALAHENQSHGTRELYRRAMVVGFDHIGSLINVLVLLYAATGLPLLLLLETDPAPWWVKLSGEGLASEVSSILISTLCLLLAVPLTTLIAAQFFRGGKHAPSGHTHIH